LANRIRILTPETAAARYVTQTTAAGYAVKTELPTALATAIGQQPTVTAAAASAVNGALAAQNINITLVYGPVSFVTTAATVVRGTPSYASAGKIGQSLTGGVLGLGNVLEPTSDTITLEAWVTLSAAPAGNPDLVFSFGTSLWLGIRTDGKPSILIANGATAQIGPTSIADGAWHHVAVELSRANTTTTLRGFWVDGTPVLSSPYTGTSQAWLPALGVAGFPTTTTGFDFDLGRIDEFRVSTGSRYTGAFTPQTTPFTWDMSTLRLAHLEDGNYLAPGSSSAYAARPTLAPAGTVTYIGPVAPADKKPADRWIKL
jgi:hypothetical protein